MRTGLTVAFFTLVTGCQYPATVVEVVTSTDAPTGRSMILSAEVRRESGPTLRRVLVHLDRLEGRLPISFGVLPAESAPEAPLTVRLEAYFPARGMEPERTISRVARFGFADGMHTRLPLFLSWSCGNETTGCQADATVPCTVARRCEERGLTCTGSGACASPDETPVNVPNEDAGLSTLFDIGPSDTVSTDAPDAAMDAAMDAPVDMAVDAAMDARIDVPQDEAIDAPMDVRTDVRMDGPTDAAMDVRTDAPIDAGMDVRSDVPAADTRVCVPNARRCSGAQLYICNSSGTAESFQTTCASPALCTSGTGTSCAAAACSSGQYRCDGANYQQCNASLTGWNTLQTCGTGTRCTTGGCMTFTQVCTPGHRHCSACPTVTSDDCVMECRSDGSGWDAVQNCGWGQPESCHPGNGTNAYCI